MKRRQFVKTSALAVATAVLTPSIVLGNEEGVAVWGTQKLIRNDVLKVIPVSGIEDYMGEVARNIYGNKSYPSITQIETEGKLRYLQQTTTQIVSKDNFEYELAKVKLARSFNRICDRGIVDGVCEPGCTYIELSSNEESTIRILSVRIVLREDHKHLSKEDLNKILKEKK